MMGARQWLKWPLSSAQGARARQLIGDVWRYGVVSGLALALDWSLLVGLVRTGMNYVPAAAVSFLAGMVVAYLGSIIFVYRDRRGYPVLAEATGFFLIGIAGLLINVLLLIGFVHILGLSVGIAKAPTAVCVFLFNFLIRRMLLFAGGPAAALVAEEARPSVELPY